METLLGWFIIPLGASLIAAAIQVAALAGIATMFGVSVPNPVPVFVVTYAVLGVLNECLRRVLVAGYERLKARGAMYDDRGAQLDSCREALTAMGQRMTVTQPGNKVTIEAVKP